MAVPEWLFGPAGDLRPLPAPDMDVVNTVQRFGGVHNAINGARTVDVLGHRSNYEFDLPYLTPDEYFRLEALYTETVPGPFWLIDPLRKNLLSREAALGRPADASGRGVRAGTSNIKWIRLTDVPSSMKWNQRAIEWTNLSTTQQSYLWFDSNTRFPVKATTPITVSALIKSTEPVVVYWIITYFDALGNQIESHQSSDKPQDSAGWRRAGSTSTPPEGAVEAYAVLWTKVGTAYTSNTKVHVLNPQVEYGSEATAPAIGGGAAKVVIDSMDTTSPYFPYQSVSLSLLEV